ncbi:DUF998 domain-containing protein, partial [Micromonospora azadirachtae]
MPTAAVPLGSAAGTLSRTVRTLAVAHYVGLVGAGTAMLLFGVLHLPGHPVDPVRDTVSDYALSRHGWLFNVAVLTLAAGSALLLAPAVRQSGRSRAPWGGPLAVVG